MTEYQSSELTIIIPIYNKKKYLEDCLNSILNQTVSPEHVILVDDGSTDGSGGICDKYAIKNSNFIVIHQENQGVSSARYNGLCMTKTKYVTFVDADDFIEKCLVEKVIPYMKKDIDIISFEMIRYFDDNYKRYDALKHPKGIYYREEMECDIFPGMLWDPVKHNCGVDASLCNKVVKKELYLDNLEKIRHVGIHYGEDVGTIYFTLLHANSYAILEDHLYYHRQRKKGELAEYISDPDYINNLHELYVFMLDRIKGKKDLIKQLEYFYLHALEVRTRVYGDYRTRRQYVFPFDKVEPGKTLALYGAGIVGQDYFRQIKAIDYCNKIVWVDNNHEKYSSLGVFPTEEIYKDKRWDYVVIAISDDKVALEVKDELIKHGYAEEKIIWNIR